MANNALPARDEIEAKYKWKLEDIYSSDADWEEDFKKVRELSGRAALTKQLAAYATLLEC